MAAPEEVPGYIVPNLCAKCAYQNPSNPVTCEAFPNGIPMQILLGVFDHRQTYDFDGVDDQMLTFEPRNT